MKNKMWLTLIPLTLVTVMFFQNCSKSSDSSSSTTAAGTPVSATTVNSGSQAVQLTWVSPLDDQQTGYVLEQSSDGVNFTQVQELNGSLTTTQVTGLSSGQTYYFRLQATNSAGASAYTPVVDISL